MLPRLEQYLITGRGLVYATIQPDPVLVLRERVVFDNGVQGMVWGIERHMSRDGGDPGKPIGVLLDVNLEPSKYAALVSDASQEAEAEPEAQSS